MLKVYPSSKVAMDPHKFAPEYDPTKGIDHLDLYDKDNGSPCSSYDSVLKKDCVFKGIRKVQKKLDDLMKMRVSSEALRRGVLHAYIATVPANLNQRKFPSYDLNPIKIPLSGEFGEHWQWEITRDVKNACLVFMVWKNP